MFVALELPASHSMYVSASAGCPVKKKSAANNAVAQPVLVAVDIAALPVCAGVVEEIVLDATGHV